MLTFRHLSPFISIVLIMNSCADPAAQGELANASQRNSKTAEELASLTNKGSDAHSVEAGEGSTVEAILGGPVDPSDLQQTTAQQATPISGTYLTFSLPPEWRGSKVDAYVLGKPSGSRVVPVSETEFQLYDVPNGPQELIVTASRDQDPIKAFSHGIKLPVQIEEDGPVIEIPKLDPAVLVQQQTQMNGITSFASVTGQFPGTKFAALTFGDTGSSSQTRLVPGEFKLNFEFKDSTAKDVQNLNLTSGVQPIDLIKPIKSRPFKPISFAALDAGQSTQFKWEAGSAQSSKTFTLIGWKEIPEAKVRPEDGKSYAVSADTLYHGPNTEIFVSKTRTENYVAYSVFATSENLIHSDPNTILEADIQRDRVYRYYRLMIEKVQKLCGTGMHIGSVQWRVGMQWQPSKIMINSGNIVSIGGRYAVLSGIAPVLLKNLQLAAYGNSSQTWTILAWGLERAPLSNPYNNSGIWMEMDFTDKPAALTGLALTGGFQDEPSCAPSQWSLHGSQDRKTWDAIPGSFVQGATGGSEYRYIFDEKDKSLGSPYLLKFAQTTNGTQLNWQSPAGRTIGYMIHRSQRPDDFLVTQGVNYEGKSDAQRRFTYIGPTTNYLDTDVKPGAIYYYAVYAFDRDYNYSDPVLGSPAPAQAKIAKFWRINILNLTGNNSTNSAALDQIRFLFNGNWQSAKLSTTPERVLYDNVEATLSASSTMTGKTVNQAFIGEGGHWMSALSTYMSTYPYHPRKIKTGEWLQLEWTGQAPAISGISLTGTLGKQIREASYDLQQQMPNRILIQTSNDGKAWTPLFPEAVSDYFFYTKDFIW